MNYYEATSILQVPDDFTDKELRRAYLVLCLKYHPDKNLGTESHDEFIKVKEAYDYLKDMKDHYTFSDINDTSYISILNSLLGVLKGENIHTNLPNIIVECQKYSVNIFDNLKKEQAKAIFFFLREYSKLLYITDEMLTKMKDILDKKLEDEEIIDFNVSLDDLFEHNIFKYIYDDGNTFFIPMWLGSVEFRTKDDTKDIIFTSILTLPKYINIDVNNNIHINITCSIQELLQKEFIEFTFKDKINIKVAVNTLRIRKYQIITHYGLGVPTIDVNNIYSVGKRSNIVIHIHIN